FLLALNSGAAPRTLDHIGARAIIVSASGRHSRKSKQPHCGSKEGQTMKISKKLLAPLIVLLPSAALAEVHVYSAIPLIGTEEAPKVFSSGYGVFTGLYDDNTTIFHY